MKLFLKTISYFGLALTLLPSFFVLAGVIEFRVHLELMLTGSILWFFTAPFWLNKKDGLSETV